MYRARGGEAVVSSYCVTLRPVFSCLADGMSAGVSLPAGLSSLSWHQVATFEALSDPHIDVIFNTAMTGDGKSLAAFLKCLVEDFYALALYPTNELARDQEKQINGYIQKFKPRLEPRVNRLSSADLEVYAENEKLRKSAAIETRAGQSEILISNSDILHYLHFGCYLSQDDSPDRLWGKIDKEFKLFIFDEFHVFQTPQVAGVLNTMLLIKHTNRHNKFLFLSATPNEQLLEKLEVAGFRCKLIDPLKEGKYYFGDVKEGGHGDTTPTVDRKWRQILREVTLNFVSLESTFQSAENWLQKNSNLILSYFLEQPGSKGAIILNSIASVKRLTPFFKALLAPYGLVVGENTGLSGTQTKALSLEADLVLGTSTIDVGVDFKINFLIFESADAGNFIQRLGRLGRHDGYAKNGEFVVFEKFTSYALIPKFLVERLFLGETPPLATGGIYDRPFLQQSILENYRKINNFERYDSRWGVVQSFVLCQKLGHPTIKQQYEQSQLEFRKACDLVFNTKVQSVWGRLKQWKAEWEDLSGNKTGNPIAEEAASFRGSSSLLCGIYDLTESYEADRFKTYDLPGIVSNLEIEMMTKADYMRVLEETAGRLKQPIAKGRYEYCLGFMKLHSYRPERLNWKFIYSGDLQPVAESWKVQILTGLQIWQPGNYWIDEVNKRLKKQALVSYVINRPVVEVRARLRLPMHFQIYPISDNYSLHDAGAPYCIAFGQSALLIDTLAGWFKSKGGEIWIC
ncbi:MAG TPA: type I-D CRISPR-associated helicase Cas3' [Halomicronema sp.]